METFIEPIPTWALCYLINGDADGLTDEDIALIDSWLELTHFAVLATLDEETTFNPYPAFGLACDTADCVCVIR